VTEGALRLMGRWVREPSGFGLAMLVPVGPVCVFPRVPCYVLVSLTSVDRC
jgi:hypothetical protein